VVRKSSPKSFSSQQEWGNNFVVEMSVVKRIRSHRHSKEGGRLWQEKENICEGFWKEDSRCSLKDGQDFRSQREKLG
jgi:hypothetical protein